MIKTTGNRTSSLYKSNRHINRYIQQVRLKFEASTKKFTSISKSNDHETKQNSPSTSITIKIPSSSRRLLILPPALLQPPRITAQNLLDDTLPRRPPSKRVITLVRLHETINSITANTNTSALEAMEQIVAISEVARKGIKGFVRGGICLSDKDDVLYREARSGRDRETTGGIASRKKEEGDAFAGFG